MTASELRALIAGATPGEWSSDFDDSALCVCGSQVARVYWHNQRNKRVNAALIVALVNNAERFAELLEAEEAKTAPIGEWRECVCYPEERNLWFDGSVWGWVAPEGDGWTAHADRFLIDYEKVHPTESEARAAVEDAVRAGR